MTLRRLMVISAAILSLSGCGGGDGSGGDSGSSAPPTTAFTPAPSPTPSPSPTISAVSFSPMLARIYFYPRGFLAPESAFVVFSDRQGQYPSSSPLSSKVEGIVRADYAGFEKSSYGVDPSTNILYGFRSPANATVISPITHMLAMRNDQAALKDQLGLTVGTATGFAVDRNLETFNPVSALASADANTRADGERLLARHLRLSAMACATSHLVGAVSQVRFIDCDFDAVAAHLANHPRANAFNEASIAALLASKAKDRVLPAAVMSATSRIVALYLSMIPDRVSTREDLVRYQLAAAGYLVPLVSQISGDLSGDAATLANAITLDGMRAATARYGEALTYPADARYYPAPDFYQLARGATFVVRAAYGGGSNGSDGPFTYNDAHLEGADGFYFLPRGVQTLVSVEVPAANVGEISAVLNADGSVTMAAVGAFTGVTYFDYVTRHEKGDTARGRVYVSVGQ